MVRSTFKIARVWLVIIVFLSTFLFGLDLILFPKPMSHKHNSTNSIFPGLIFLFLGIYMIYLIFKYLTVITISDNSLGLKNLFSRKELLPAEIQSIALYGREKLMGSKYATDAIILTLKEGKKILLPDNSYSNIQEIRAALAEKFPDKISDLPVHKEKSFVLTWHPDWTTEEGMDTFKGNPLLSTGSMVKIGITIFFIVFGALLRQVLLHSSRHYRPETTRDQVLLYYFPIVAIILTFFFMQARELYYFRLSSACLVVRNHFYPWVNKVYIPDDISALRLERSRSGVQSLHIQTKDFGGRHYGAGSLKKETWQAFISEVEALGIPVINDIKGLS